MLGLFEQLERFAAALSSVADRRLLVLKLLLDVRNLRVALQTAKRASLADEYVDTRIKNG